MLGVKAAIIPKPKGGNVEDGFIVNPATSLFTGLINKSFFFEYIPSFY